MLILSCFRGPTHVDRVGDASDWLRVSRLFGFPTRQSFWAELAADAAALHTAEM
jgi:hypothetical protein